MVQKNYKKINVAFIVSSNSAWLGEQNYFASLLGSINELDDRNFNFYIFTGFDERFFIQKKYKKLKFIRSRLLNKNGPFSICKKISSFFFKRYDPILLSLFKKHSINILSHYKPIYGVKNLTWFPDFQHTHLPKYFSKEEIISRDKMYLNYIKFSDKFIVSSKSAKKDLIKFKRKNHINVDRNKIKVLHFIPNINLSKIKKKTYFKNFLKINENFIFVPNQFWAHKNHECIINALSFLNKKGIKIKCILTGKNFDHRNPYLFKSLIKKVKQFKLYKQILYRGILPYDDVISLIYHSTLVINPSFFEGWSTTVEEAKLLNKKIILSDITTHLEQNPKNAVFFDPKKPNELAKKIEKNFFKKLKNKKNLNFLKKNYEIKKKEFAIKYCSFLRKI